MKSDSPLIARALAASKAEGPLRLPALPRNGAAVTEGSQAKSRRDFRKIIHTRPIDSAAALA